MNSIPFDKWVNDNNPDSSLSYGKGWWDYIEFIRLLNEKFNFSEINVVSTYIMETPPPTEKLLMPIIMLKIKQITFILKYDFSIIAPYWTVSVIRNNNDHFKKYNIFNEHDDLRDREIQGFKTQWIFPPYCENHSKFTCRVDDEWDMYALIKIIINI